MSKEEFYEIIDRYLEGKASAEEKQLIDNFFDAQQKRFPADGNVPREEMWRAMHGRIAPLEPQVRRRQGDTMLTLLALAGVLLVFLSVGLLSKYFWGPGQPEVVWHTLESGYGKKTTFTLDDGSKVFLNAGSSLSYPEKFDASVREVVLKGEAFFDVARNVNQPFLVRSENVTTEVLGTSFNVQAFPGQRICVTVASGKVRVEAVHNSGAGGPPPQAERVLLNPKEQAVFVNNELSKSEVDTARFLAWKRNILRFDDVSLAQVVKALERWYNIDITFSNEEILNCRINGQFKEQSLESVLNSIQYMYNIDYRYRTQNQIVLYGKGCLK
jgi:ferric-dicitrate binding protein FerR (iron transport regulator)